MPTLASPETERRALALFEHLADDPANTKLRARLTKNEPEDVLTRLAALEASVTKARGAIPTLIPGSADCGAALPPPERVGPFRLIERIGRGGMGDVWLGQRDDGLYDQKVAVKLIQRHALARAAAAFEDERRFLARLEHPNIARLIDGGVTEDGLPWLVMEFIEGQTIDEACARLSDAARAGLFVKAADAVQYAHSKLVAHADLKPGNILVGANGRVKLLDFGIASLIGDGSRSPTGSGPLTREFASPQRIAGGGPSVSDDVYALGKTLALVLDGSDDAELSAIAAKAHEVDEADRYGSVAALIADLDRWRAQLPVLAMHDGWNYRVGKFVDRHRMGVLATGTALTLLSATSLIATSSYVRAERQRSEASARFEDARGTARYVSFNLLNRLAAQPGTLGLRLEAAEVAQHYLDRLAASPSAPPAMRLEASEGLLRLAEAQGRPGVPNLGQPEAARANLEKAHEVIQGIDGIAASRLAIRIRLDQARLVTYADHATELALTYLRDADAMLRRKGAATPLLRSQYLDELSSALQWQGNYPAAIKAARDALAALPSDEARDTLILRASASDLMAESTYYADRQQEAIAPYRQALATLERAHALYPQDQIVARRLGRAQWALGTTLVDFGDKAEALSLIEKASVSARASLAFDPNDVDAERMLSIAENARGQALAANGRVEEALALFKTTIAERKARFDAHPELAMRLRDYIVAVKTLGDTQTDFGRTIEGCRTFAEVRALLSQQAERKRLTGLDMSSVVGNLDQRERAHCIRAVDSKKS